MSHQFPPPPALQKGNQIFVAPNNAANLILHYCHVVGHYLAKLYSFEEDFLLPKDLKQTVIDLTDDERKLIVESLKTQKTSQLDGLELEVSNRLLKTFSKDNFKEIEIKLINVSQKEIESMVKQESTVTTDVSDDGSFVYKDDPLTLAFQTATYFIEVSCLRLLEQSIVADEKYKIRIDSFPGESPPVHVQAHTIATYLFESNQIPPSVNVLTKVKKPEIIQA